MGEDDVSDNESPAPPFALRQRLVRIRALLTTMAIVTVVMVAFLGHVKSAPHKLETQTSTVVTLNAVQDNCLCVFDIDRTLTSKQQWANVEHPCPGAVRSNTITDTAYSPGKFVASALTVNINSTFCKRCYTGVVSHGVASYTDEHNRILDFVGGAERTRTDWWQYIGFNTNTEAKSSLILQAVDGYKQVHIRGIVDWLNNVMNIPMQDTDVYFYDDIATNVEPFKNTKFNARQISCKSRGPAEPNVGVNEAGKLGGCGATPDEIVEEKGVKLCDEN